MDAVYLQTNDAEKNEVVAFRRDADGKLSMLGTYPTEGRGTGKPHLASQSSIVVSGDRLLVVNAGSDDVTLFAIAADGLSLLDRAASGGSMPTSIAVRDASVFVLNAGGDPNVTGFTLGDERADGDRRHAGASRCGSRADRLHAGRRDADRQRPRQRCAHSIPVAGGEAMRRPSSGATPYGFDFTPDGTLVVTEAFGGTVGAAAASSYAAGLQPISKSVANTRSEVCWAAVTKDGRYVFVTNFGDGSISSYAIGVGRLALARRRGGRLDDARRRRACATRR